MGFCCGWLGVLIKLDSLLVFCRYQMPVPLLGVVLSLMMWEGVRFCGERWEMQEKYPGLRMVLVRIVQCSKFRYPFAINGF